MISIHEASQASTLYHFILAFHGVFQSTRLRKPRPPDNIQVFGTRKISIHEASQASTYILKDFFEYSKISIHEASQAST